MNRISELRRQMSAAGIDAVLLFPSSNWRYVLEFAPIANERLCALIVTQDKTAVVLPVFDEAEMRLVAGDALIFGWSDQDGPDKAVAAAWRAVDAAALQTIAVDDGMPYLFTRVLLAHVSGARLGLFSTSLPRYRLIKDQEEIQAIRQAAQLIERTLAAVPGMLAAGMAELELERLVKADMLAHGAATLDYALVQFGANSAIPHHVAGNRMLEPNTNVLLDIAVTYRDYFADITRQVVLGDPGPDYRAAFDVVRAAQAAGVEAAGPGATVGDVDRACREVIVWGGYGDAFFTRTGHGLGLDVHEPPSVVAGNDLMLEPGMVITVEPGVYLAGKFGVRIEDTIAITESGADRLSASERDLVVAT
ncbi:MAG TPA: Xaa-Pro peptidase family protein [Streptosporangiaceae bacterium]|nr:Xaa-Pro peptidase family protein [Streptosporangiaceae bacterium]